MVALAHGDTSFLQHVDRGPVEETDERIGCIARGHGHTRVPGVIGLYSICQEWLRWCCASSAWLTNSVITGTSAPRTWQGRSD